MSGTRDYNSPTQAASFVHAVGRFLKPAIFVEMDCFDEDEIDDESDAVRE